MMLGTQRHTIDVRSLAPRSGAGALVIKSLVFPEWWLFVPVPVCFGLLAVECLRRLLRPGMHAEPVVAGLEPPVTDPEKARE